MSRMGELAAIEAARTAEAEALAPRLYESLKAAVAYIELRLAFASASVGTCGEHLQRELQIARETSRISIGRGDLYADFDLQEARELIQAVDAHGQAYDAREAI